MTDHDTFLVEYSSWVDRVHRSTPEAEAPPADLWQRILAQANPQPKETNQMSSITTAAVPMAPARPVDSRTRGGFGHYLNLAATIALVLAVAVAGWFATMQLNQPGNPEPRFAAIPATPESMDGGMCTVEPLTTDEAIQILKNPFVHIGISEDVLDQSVVRVVIDEEETLPGVWPIVDLMTDGPTMNIGAQDREDAYEVGDQYLACLSHGTNGQVWRMLEPIRAQWQLRGLLPLFVTEEEARAIIAQALSEPAESRWNSPEQQEYLQDKRVVMNPDYSLAYVDDSEIVNRAYMDTLVIVPVMIIDADGETVFAAEYGGFPIVNNGYARDYAANIVLGKSELNGSWYVLGFFLP